MDLVGKARTHAYGVGAVMPRALVEVKGRASVVRTLKKFGLAMEDFLEVNTALARDAAELVASEAPIRSGRLRSDVRGNKAKTRISVLAGRVRIPYAGPINWGWPSRPNHAKGWRGGPIPANNFMQRGAEKAVPIVAHGWESHLEHAAQNVKGI